MASPQVVALQQQISTLQSQLSALQGAASALADASQQIDDLKAQLADLQGQLASALADDDADKAQIADLQNQLATVQADDSADKATIADLQKQLADLQAKQTPPPVPTAVNTLVTTMVMANGDVWTLGAFRSGTSGDKLLLRNGVGVSNGAGAQYMTTDGISVYVVTVNSAWWKLGAGDVWQSTTDPRVSAPPVVTPPATGAFTIQASGATFADWGSAEAKAKDGDVVLVQPGVYTCQTNGFSTNKCLTIKSAVPGKRYTVFVKRDMTRGSNGAIGPGFGCSGYDRATKLGLTTPLDVSLEDAEIYADGLTFNTGSVAVWAECRPGGTPVNLAVRRSFIHDYDQGVETGNEYDQTSRNSTVLLENTIIYQTGTIGSGDANHCIYVGEIASLTMRGVIVHTKKKADWTGPTFDASGSVLGPNYWPVGHLVKCRAKSLDIQACRLTAEDTTVSEMIECSNGGDVYVVGNVLEKGTISDSNSVISYGRSFTAAEPGGFTGIVSGDGRTNRLRVYQNTIVNQDVRNNSPQQFVELSYQVPAGAVEAHVENNVFADAGSNGILPDKGYPGVGTQSGVLSVVGVPITGAVNNVAIPTSQLVAANDRYTGWCMASPPTGTARAALALVDVAPADYATKFPDTVARNDANYGALAPAPPVPAAGTPASWYAKTLLNGWSRLDSFPAIYSRVQSTLADRDPATRKEIYPFTGFDSAGYVGNDGHNGPWPYAKDAQGNPVLVAGVPPIPGYMDFRGDQGACICYNATAVVRGVTYKGTFIVWFAQGGHGVGLNNQILGYHVESGTFLDFTQQSIPPLGSIGTTPAWRPDDGRWYSTHGYNNGVFDQTRNTVIQQAGPAQVGGPGSFGATYAYCLLGDGWAGPNAVSDPSPGKDYFSSAGGATANGRNATMCVDNVKQKIWNSYPNSPYVNTVAVVSANLAPGSQWHYVELAFRNGAPQLGGASCAQKALEGEPWIVYMSEINPYRATILNHEWIAGGSGAYGNNPNQWEPNKRGVWNVTFTPKDGNPVNAIPTTVLTMSQIPNVDNVVDKSDPSNPKPVSGIPATWTYDFEARVIYVCVYCVDDTPLMDVYKIPLPPFDKSGADGIGSTFVQGIGTANEVVTPWVTEKIAKNPASITELPTRGNGTGPWYPAHNTMFYVPVPNKGLMFVHDPSKSPLFFGLAA